jgi:hypothetical protein
VFRSSKVLSSNPSTRRKIKRLHSSNFFLMSKRVFVLVWCINDWAHQIIISYHKWICLEGKKTLCNIEAWNNGLARTWTVEWFSLHFIISEIIFFVDFLQLWAILWDYKIKTNSESKDKVDNPVISPAPTSWNKWVPFHALSCTVFNYLTQQFINPKWIWVKGTMQTFKRPT